MTERQIAILVVDIAYIEYCGLTYSGTMHKFYNHYTEEYLKIKKTCSIGAFVSKLVENAFDRGEESGENSKINEIKRALKL